MIRVLLDEMLSTRLAGELSEGIQGISVRRMEWKGKKNGELLQLAANASFDAVLTLDKTMRHQLNEAILPLPVIVMHPDPAAKQRLIVVKALIADHAIGLLRQNLENRFYNVGPGYHSDEGRGDG